MTHSGLGGLSALAAAAILGVFLAGPAHATDCYWVHDPSTPGDWWGAGNWDPSAPRAWAFADNVIIDNGGTGVATAYCYLYSMKVGDSYAGSVTESADSTDFHVLHGLWLGYRTGASGTYTLTGGGLTGSWHWVGYEGTGNFTQSGGRHSAGDVILGGEPGGVGTYALSGGSLFTDYITVGDKGNGRFTQTGGYSIVSEWVNIGYKTGGSGTYSLEGGSLSTGWMEIGTSGPGIFTQSAGTNCVINDLYVGSAGYYAAGTGAYELRGGSLAVGGVVVLGDRPAPWLKSSPGVLDVRGGSLVANGAIILARGSACTADLAVSTGAYVQTGGLTINQGEGRSTRVIVEVASDGSSLIHTKGTSTLAGVLDVQSLGHFRPREGDRFTVITSSDPSGVYFTGNFSTFTSNIALGLPPGAGAFNGSPNGCNYDVVFLGYTAGDANGDHIVDGGDLALMHGNWMQEDGWGGCDFNGDGVTDGADLALMGGNWMWVLPEPAPPDGMPLPEPSTVALLTIGGLTLVRRKR